MFNTSKKKLDFPGDAKSTYKKKSYEKKDIAPYDEKRLWTYCIWLLSKRDYTAFEITSKMKKHQPDMEQVQNVLEKLIQSNYINDERRSTSIAQSYLQKEAPSKLKQRLSMKGVDKDTINLVIEQNSSPELEFKTALTLLERKFKTYNKDVYSKYVSHLSMRGFSWEIISKSIIDFKNKSFEENQNIEP